MTKQLFLAMICTVLVLSGCGSDSVEEAVQTADTAATDTGKTTDAGSDTGSCVKACTALECGPDGCGGLCGVCAGEELCVAGQCVTDPVCGAVPDCECIMAECQNGLSEFGGTPKQACELLEATGACEEALIAEYKSGGCPAACAQSVFPTFTAACSEACPAWATNATLACEACVGCVPSCSGKNCGPDGCSGTCGGCGANESCESGVCAASGCSANPTCECLISECWGLENLPVPVDVVCSALGECKDEIAVDYLAFGCPDLCGEYGLPAFPSLCTADSCSDLLSVAPGFCAECGGCTPECGNNACGPDGCGGSCGACGDGEICQGSSCEPLSSCDTTSSCACALTACTDVSILPLPLEAICGFLEATPACAAAVLGDYDSAGCPDVCQGGDLPLFPSLCTAPACESLSGFMGQACDVCL